MEHTEQVDTGERVEVEVEAVVNDDGDVVVPSSQVAELDLTPGDRVKILMPRPRQDMYGVLKGKTTPITREEIKEASREAWGEWIDD